MDKVQLVKSHRVSQSAETSKPNAGRTIGRYLVAMLIAVALVAAGAPTATAEEGLLSDNAGQSDQSDNANSSSEPDKDEPDPDSSTVTSPDPDRWPETRIGIGSALVTTTSGDMTVGLSMDDALTTERVTSTTGDTLLQDVLDGVNLAIKTQDTGFSIIAEIQSLSSPHEIGFDASIPTGAVLELLEDGSIDVIDENGLTIGSFAPPWAKDAAGNSISTHYRLVGTTIVQTIAASETTEYPVIADPEWTWGWISGTIYFNRSETYHICHQPLNAVAILMTLISALAKQIPRLGRLIAGIPGGVGFIASVVDAAVCGWFLGSVTICLKIKIGGVPGLV